MAKKYKDLEYLINIPEQKLSSYSFSRAAFPLLIYLENSF